MERNAAVHDFLAAEQARIVAALEAADGGRFGTDRWQRPEGGGGTTRMLEDGALFERAGVNVSRVQGATLPASATASRPSSCRSRLKKKWTGSTAFSSTAAPSPRRSMRGGFSTRRPISCRAARRMRGMVFSLLG